MKTLIDKATSTGAGTELINDQRGYATRLLMEIVITGTATVTWQVRAARENSLDPAAGLHNISSELVSDGSAVTSVTSTSLVRVDMTAIYSLVPTVSAYTSGEVSVRVFEAIG